MAGRVEELKRIMSPQNLAGNVYYAWERYRQQRIGWVNETKELRDFIFATDTSTTSGSSLPWKNTTVLPKITQIRDNLHSNYISALFPNDEWLKWEAYTLDEDTKRKAIAIESYMQNKTRESDFRSVMSLLLLDYIDYGNAFADVVWVSESTLDPITGEQIPGYIGPKVVRISPYDMMINPAAPDFASSPKITRRIVSLGEMKLLAIEQPEMRYMLDGLETAEGRRNTIRNGQYSIEDFDKASGYAMDGFGSLFEYYNSPYAELLEFEGDMHDPDTGELLRNRVITVMDRTTVIRNEPMSSWLPHGTKAHAAWRMRPDNLYGMSPLANLVGMQYRINHLENLKADVFDLIAYPPLKIIGEVEEFDWAPGTEIHIDAEGSDVQMLVPDTTALNADMQIDLLEQRMENFVGAPREAMGIRTPGEKTAFEVNSLQNAAGRIFQEKVVNFEITLLEPILNSMLEVSRRNMDSEDQIRIFDDDLGVIEFQEITKEDITAAGKLRPMGGRHFAAEAQLVQNMNGIFNSPIYQIIAPHVSAKALAKMVEDLFGIERYGLIRDNIAVIEAAETQAVTQAAQEELQMQAEADTTLGETQPPQEQI
jgi:hypothetical protein